MGQLIKQDPDKLYNKTAFGHSVIHLAVGWPEGLELLLDLGGKALINDVDAKGGSPLAYSCVRHHFDSARILMSNGCRIDADLLFLAISKHDLGHSKILHFILPELIRRRQQLVQFAACHLGKSFVDSLRIPPNAVPDQWAVFKIQDACHKNKIPVPENMRHSTDGLPENQRSAVWNSVFGFSRSHPSEFGFPGSHCLSTLDSLWSAGFRVGPDRLPWTFGWNIDPIKDVLDKTDWFISRGFDIHSRFAHDAASFMAYGTIGHNNAPVGWDLEKSTKKRAETFEKIYFSSYSIDHHCPCSVEGCTAATAFLVRDVPDCTVDGLLWSVFSIESTIQFSPEEAESGIPDTAGFSTCHVSANYAWAGRPCWYCRGRAQRTVWQKERWIPLASKLLRAYLFQHLRLTHSLSCCKAGLNKKGKPNTWRSFVCVHDEDTSRKRQEEERTRVVDLNTLVRELVDEFKSESMKLSMSTFIEEVAKPRAEKLMQGWNDNGPESGVIWDIESDDSAGNVLSTILKDCETEPSS